MDKRMRHFGDNLINIEVSICIGDSVRLRRWVIDGWEHSNFSVADIALPEVLSFFCVRKFHQESHNVISACIWSFIPFSEAWVMILVLHVGQAVLGTSIILSGSVVTVGMIASEPFFESHSTHDVVIGHWIKTVECALNFLLWTNTGLEGSGDSSMSESVPVHDFFFFKSPRLEKKSVDIIGLDKLVFHWPLVEEENLSYGVGLLCW